MNNYKYRPSQGSQIPSKATSTESKCKPPPRNYPIIINDMIDQKPKYPPSLRRIYKLGRKYRNQVRHQEIRNQDYRCETNHLGLVIGTHEQTFSSPSCTKIPEYRERNCKSLPDAKHLDEIRDVSFQPTSSGSQAVNFKNPHGTDIRNCESPTSTECLNVLQFDNQDCKNLNLNSNRANLEERNSVSPSCIRQNTNLNKICKTPQCSNNSGKIDRICRRNPPDVINFRTTPVSPVNVERNCRSPSPAKNHLRQGHRSKSPFHRSKSPFRLNCLERNCVSPLKIDHSDGMGSEQTSPPNINNNDKPPDNLSSFCNKTFACDGGKNTGSPCTNTSDPYHQNQSAVDTEGQLEIKYNTTCYDGKIENSKIAHFVENFDNLKERTCRSPECEGNKCIKDYSDKHTYDHYNESTSRERESRSRHRVYRRLINPIRSKSCDSPVKNCWTSFREHNDDSIRQIQGQLPSNTYIQDTGNYNIATSEISGNSNFDCGNKERTTSINAVGSFETCEQNCKTPQNPQNCDISDQTHKSASCKQYPDITENNGISLLGNSDNGSRMFCVTSGAIKNSNDKTEEYRENSGFYDEFQRDRSQSISDKLCSSNKYRRSPTSNEIYEINCERDNRNSESATELNKLGKKCRSISSAHQERRRWGTPLTLILYVKKKCQNKIRKIL